MQDTIDGSITPEVVKSIDILIRACTSHEKFSNQVIVYSHVIKMITQSSAIEKIINDRLKALGYAFSETISGTLYHPKETGTSWHGFISTIDKTEFNKGISQMPIGNINEISSALSTFYDVLLRSFINYYDEMQSSNMTRSQLQQFVATLDRERKAIRQKLRHPWKKFCHDQELYESIAPICDNYKSRKNDLIVSVLTKLKR